MDLPGVGYPFAHSSEPPRRSLPFVKGTPKKFMVIADV